MPDYSSFTEPALLATCAWKEGRGEIKQFGIVSVVAIMHAIVNRVDEWNQSLSHVILGKNQFTSMSVASDPEFELLPTDDDPQYLDCLEAAKSILSGQSEDPTRGACYYARLSIIDRTGWFWRHIVMDQLRHPLTIKIGNHTFFE